MKLTARHLLIAAVVIVAAVLVLASRFTGGGTSGVATVQPTPTTPTASAAAPTPSGSAAPATTTDGGEDPGHDDGDDGVSSDPPIMVTPTNRPDLDETATAFTAAWLNTSGRTPEVWRAALTPRITDDLAADLAAADPDSVPAGAKVGPVEVTAVGSLFTAAVDVLEVGPQNKPIGTLTLTLVRTGASYLVSEIDWEPTR